MRRVVNFLKPFFLAPFVLYIFNKMAVIIDVFIPINLFTVLIVGLFNILGLIFLIILYFIVI